MSQPSTRLLLSDATSLQELLGHSQELRAESRFLCAKARLMTARQQDLKNTSALLMVAFSSLKIDSRLE